MKKKIYITVLISQDGVKWKQHVLWNDIYLGELIKVGDYIYSFGNGIYRSKDCINWSKVLACKTNNQYIKELTWDGKKNVALDQDNNIIFSTDGIIWKIFCKISMSEVYSLASDGKHFVILASQNYPNTENSGATNVQTGVFYSIDGVKWTNTMSVNDDANVIHWNGKQL